MANTPKLIACAALALVLAAAPSADAGPKQEARAHVERATKHHKAGDLDKALIELQAAYGLDPQPKLLYAIGQIYTKLGRCSEASDAYLRFLASGTDARTAQVVKQAIDSCKPGESTEPAPEKPAPPEKPAAPARPESDDETPPNMGAAKAAPTPPPAAEPKQVAEAPSPEPGPPPMSDKTSPWYSDVLGDVLVIGGVTSLVLGGLAYRAARADLDTAEKLAPNHEEYEKLLDTARTKRLAGVALAGGGVVLVTAGVLRFMLRDNRKEVRSVGVAPTSGGGLLTWTRSF